MTAAALKARTLKDLAQLAKKSGVSGWNSMRKEELVKAILRRSTKVKPAPTAKTNGKSTPSKVAPIIKNSAKTPVSAKSATSSAKSTVNGTKSSSAKSTIAAKAPVKANPAKHANIGQKQPIAAKSVVASKTTQPAKSLVAAKPAAAKVTVTKISPAHGVPAPSKLGVPAPSKLPEAVKPLVRQLPPPPVISPAEAEQNKRVMKKLDAIRAKEWSNKNLAPVAPVVAEVVLNKPMPLKGNWPTKDRLVVMVRGPYWLHATWNLTPAGVQRAQAALAQDWHLAKPILRVINISSSGSSTSSERIMREIPIHGGVKNWFIDVNNPPQTYRLEIGYLSNKGRFFCMARSNTVSTPPPQVGDSLETHWADIALDCEKIYALSGGNGEAISDLQDLFAERTQKPLTAISVNGHHEAATDAVAARSKSFKLEVEAEVVLRGMAAPGSTVMVQGEPIKLHPDGTFSVSMDFPNRRQVIPIIANSKDGVLQRTLVLAVERNTKAMEPHARDQGQD